MNRQTRIILVLVACAYFAYYAITYTDWHFIDNVNLIFHEAGHVIFSFLGTYIRIAAGSLFQIALPLLIASYFLKEQQYISAAFCVMWSGQNMLNVSVYAADALVRQLPLLGGDAVMHDWNYLLGTIGMLKYTSQIAAAIYALGMVTIIAGAAWSLYSALKKDEVEEINAAQEA